MNVEAVEAPAPARLSTEWAIKSNISSFLPRSQLCISVLQLAPGLLLHPRGNRLQITPKACEV